MFTTLGCTTCAVWGQELCDYVEGRVDQRDTFICIFADMRPTKKSTPSVSSMLAALSENDKKAIRKMARQASKMNRKEANKSFRDEQKYLGRLESTLEKDLRPQDKEYLGKETAKKKMSRGEKIGSGLAGALIGLLAAKTGQDKYSKGGKVYKVGGKMGDPKKGDPKKKKKEQTDPFASAINLDTRSAKEKKQDAKAEKKDIRKNTIPAKYRGRGQEGLDEYRRDMAKKNKRKKTKGLMNKIKAGMSARGAARRNAERLAGQRSGAGSGCEKTGTCGAYN